MSCSDHLCAYVIHMVMLSISHSVIEMQAMLANLLENFEFSLPPECDRKKIYRRPTTFMMPMTDDFPGAYMGLKIKSVK